MISIRDAISDLEKSDRLRLLTLDCYVTAIQNAAQYAVELDDPITEPYRKYLKELAGGLSASTPEILSESRSSLRALFRDYRDKASEYLSHLREELATAANALQEILSSFNRSEGDHETRLKQAVKTLQKISGSSDIEIIRSALVGATTSIEESLEELRKQHQLTVSQFLVEIRTLHKRIDTLERAAALDALTKLFSRTEMEKRIRGAQDGASLLAVSASGIRRAETDFSPETAKELAAAFTKRLRNSLTATAALGRWGEEEFIAIGPHQKAEALMAAKWITEHLSGVYACLHVGKTVRPTIKVDVMVVDREPEGDGESALTQVHDYFKD